MNNKKKMTFLDYFILKIIVAGTFFFLYLKPAAFKIPGVETYPDALIICKGAALLMSIFTMSQVFDAIYKVSQKRD